MLFAENYIKQCIADGAIKHIADVENQPSVELVFEEEMDQLSWVSLERAVYEVTATDGTTAHVAIDYTRHLTESCEGSGNLDEPSLWRIFSVVPQTKTVTVTEYVSA